MILPPVGLVIMKLGNLSSYKFLNSQLCFAYLLTLLNSWVPPLPFPPGVICSCFNMQLLGVLKLIFYLLVDMSIRFTVLLGVFGILVERYILLFFSLFCFKMRICCRFTVRKQEVLLNYVGTPQWGPHGDNFT